MSMVTNGRKAGFGLVSFSARVFTREKRGLHEVTIKAASPKRLFLCS